MISANLSPPRHAANNNDRALRTAPMSTRRHRTKSGSLRKRREALRDFDIDCDCKCTLIVSCAIGTEPGCRERRRDGTCGCRPRWLPTCILEKTTPHGCPVWQEGHQCHCQRLYMPRCLVTGCEDRRTGHRCECPRTPTEVCSHVLELAERFADLRAEDAEAYSDEWARQQRQFSPQEYQELPLADAGAYMGDREVAISMMELRVHAGRSPRHPADWGLTNRRRRQQEENRCLEGMAAGFLKLLYAMRRKGGANGDAA